MRQQNSKENLAKLSRTEGTSTVLRTETKIILGPQGSETAKAPSAFGEIDKEYNDFIEQNRAYFSKRSGLTLSLPQFKLIHIGFPDQLPAISQKLKQDSVTDSRGNTTEMLSLETETIALIKGKVICADFARALTNENDRAEALKQARSWLKDFKTANSEKKIRLPSAVCGVIGPGG